MAAHESSKIPLPGATPPYRATYTLDPEQLRVDVTLEGPIGQPVAAAALSTWQPDSPVDYALLIPRQLSQQLSSAAFEALFSYIHTNLTLYGGEEIRVSVSPLDRSGLTLHTERQGEPLREDIIHMVLSGRQPRVEQVSTRSFIEPVAVPEEVPVPAGPEMEAPQDEPPPLLPSEPPSTPVPRPAGYPTETEEPVRHASPVLGLVLIGAALAILALLGWLIWTGQQVPEPASTLPVGGALVTPTVTLIPSETPRPTQPPIVLELPRYTVQRGDTVTSLAERWNLNPETIIWCNQDKLEGVDHFSAGAELIIPPADGVCVFADGVQTLAEIA